MLASEIRRIVGRRGSFWSAVFVGFATVVIVIIVRLTQSGDAGGTELLDAADPMSIPATLMAVLVGALAGSYDTSQGTMRYLVMTGVPRRRLYGTRVLGTAIATILCCVPAVVLDDRRGLCPAPRLLQRPDAERRRRRGLGLLREPARVRAGERRRRLAAALQRRGHRRLARLLARRRRSSPA